MKKQTKATAVFIKQLKKHRDNIAKERDALRHLVDDAYSLAEAADGGIATLENAIEILSQQA